MNIKVSYYNKDIARVIINEPKTYNSLSFKNLNDLINELNKLSDIICCLKDRAPNLTITIDPVETRGYKYHTGVTFTFFALNVRGELGRGGRYLVDDVNKNKMPEPATGASLYLDTILRALPTPTKRDRVLVSSSNSEIGCSPVLADPPVTALKVIPTTPKVALVAPKNGT